MRKFALIAALAGFACQTAVAAEPRNPVGERAYYKVDGNDSRTTAAISEGMFDTSVTRELPDRDAPAYEVKLDYEFKVQLMGRKKGSAEVGVDAKYFGPEFIKELRESGYHETPDFKIKHEGYATVRNMDGRTYENCDKVYFYDFNNIALDELTTVWQAVKFSTTGFIGDDKSDDFEDLKIRAHLKEGLPVLGAVKIDLTGKYQGMSMKVGADYNP